MDKDALRLFIISAIKDELNYWESEDLDDYMYTLNSKEATTKIRKIADKILVVVNNYK